MGTDHQSLINQKQTLFQEKKIKKIKKINLHGAQKASQLAETTAGDGSVRLWQRPFFELLLFIASIRQSQKNLCYSKVKTQIHIAIPTNRVF